MRNLFVLIFLIILTHSSCREMVTSEFPAFATVPAVNSILIAGKPLKVHVSMADKIDTNQLTVVNNADISLFVDGNFAENLFHDENGIYFSSSIVEPLRSYELKVKVPGFDPITCKDMLPAPSPIFNIIHNNNAGKDEEGMIYPSVTFSFRTDPNERQYFEIIIRALQNRYEVAATLEKITDPVLLNEGLPLTIFSNEIIRDSVYSMTINYFSGSAGFSSNEPLHATLYPLILELRSCSGSYYQFVKQKFLYENGRSPEFLATSTNAFPLFSNVPGGYGIFAGYSVVVSDTLFPKY